MTTLDSYSTATRALLMHLDWAPTVLKLSYAISDPAAVRLELISIGRSWHIARERLAAGLDHCPLAPADVEADYASAVQVLSLALTGRTVLAFRPRAGDPLVVTVCTGALRRFLQVTYRMCSCWGEQQLLSAGLDSQLQLLSAAQEGRQL